MHTTIFKVGDTRKQVGYYFYKSPYSFWEWEELDINLNTGEETRARFLSSIFLHFLSQIFTSFVLYFHMPHYPNMEFELLRPQNKLVMAIQGGS